MMYGHIVHAPFNLLYYVQSHSECMCMAYCVKYVLSVYNMQHKFK